MIVGLTIAQFTAFHVAISLAAIGSGLVTLFALSRGARLKRTTDLFLWTTLVTTLTGFLFPFAGFTPAIGVGVFSLLPLAYAFSKRYRGRIADRGAAHFAVSAAIALWLNLFVLVVQAFLKIPALNVLAPTGTEPPFLAAQGITLLAAIALGFAARRGARRL